MSDEIISSDSIAIDDSAALCFEPCDTQPLIEVLMDWALLGVLLVLIGLGVALIVTMWREFREEDSDAS